jgi:cyclin-dependent kinase 8/11
MPLEGYTSKRGVHDHYKIVGFINSGTYGKVYKAIPKHGELREFAIKK